MNKAIQKMMLALAVCGTLCGTAMAAPKGNAPKGEKAPSAMKAQAPRAEKAKPTSTHHTAKAPAHGNTHRAVPAKQEPRHEVAHHNPPPPAHHHEPKHHGDHRGNTLHTEDWCEIGASLIGGLVGGLIGASI